MIAKTPQPPYYAVIFTSERTEIKEGYEDTAARMLELAAGQDGFLELNLQENKLELL